MKRSVSETYGQSAAGDERIAQCQRKVLFALSTCGLYGGLVAMCVWYCWRLPEVGAVSGVRPSTIAMSASASGLALTNLSLGFLRKQRITMRSISGCTAACFDGGSGSSCKMR